MKTETPAKKSSRKSKSVALHAQVSYRPLITRPISPGWILSSAVLVLFFCISIATLAGFYEIMERKYPQNFHYHRDISVSATEVDPAFDYIPAQYRTHMTNGSGFSCQEPQVKKLNMFDPLHLQDFLDIGLSDQPDADSQQVIITTR
jgi:hypothetical protein